MQHTMRMGVVGKFTIPAELPSISPDVEDQVSIFDAGANRRYGRYNNKLAPLRTWSWSDKVLSKEMSANFNPLLDPYYRDQMWFLMPCGYGVNRLSPSDSYLIGKWPLGEYGNAYPVPAKAGSGIITRVLKPDITGSTFSTVFAGVPVPEGSLWSGSKDSVNVGFWFANGKSLNGRAKITLRLFDGTDQEIMRPLPTIPGWQCFTYNIAAKGATAAKDVSEVALTVTGAVHVAMPFYHLADPSDPMATYTWEPGTGAYRVAITHAHRWKYSLYADYLDLKLVELSQLHNQR